MKIFTAPEPIQSSMMYSQRVFLAGSIEMGKAEDWQSKVISNLLPLDTRVSARTAMYNPRRLEWDSSWEQSIDNPFFYQQVDWELRALERSTIVFMHLAENTISPISLMELGLYARSEKLIVSCPKGFHRRGNVEVMAEKYNFLLFDDLGIATTHLRNILK